jgi:peptidoglycan/xylan/chitin deacetylase (PgdA/CDA1 family)
MAPVLPTTVGFKRGVKSAALHVLYALGVLQLWLRLALRRRAVVLMYHRVLEPETIRNTWSHPGIIVTRATFEQHLQLLRKYFKILSLEEFYAKLDAGGQFDAASCLVTFDDGWLDTYSVAWPGLQRHSVPAVVFLPSQFIGSKEQFWQEHLGRVLSQVIERAQSDAAFRSAATPLLSSMGLAEAITLSSSQDRMAVMQLVRARKVENGTRAAAAIKELTSLLGEAGSAPSVDAFITWDQAREMARDGITFGGHGATHRILTSLAAHDVIDEVGRCRDTIECQGLATSPLAFSYPNGNCNTMVASSVAQQRYGLAFSTDPGHVGPHSDRYRLPRMNVHEGVSDSAPMFLARILGLI